MLVKEPSFTPGRILPGEAKEESDQIVKKTWEIEDFFWWDFERLGIFPRWIEVLGDRVRVSDGTAEVRVPVGVLAAGLSIVMQDEAKRFLVKAGGDLTCQIRQIVRVEKREGHK